MASFLYARDFEMVFVYWQVNGSLLVKATNTMGSVQTQANGAEGILQYGIG